MKVFPVTMQEPDYLKVLLMAKSIEANNIKLMLMQFGTLPNGVLGAIHNRIEEIEAEIKEIDNG